MQKIRIHSSSPIVHILILVLVSLPYCIRIGSSSIWNASEAFYAETSREMMESGDYLAPHFNFEPRTQKPPLTYWAILASYKLFGINEFSARFPGCVAAIAIILFSYAIARFLFNRRVALTAAVITATTTRLIILARRLPIDILLMFFLLGTLCCLIRAVQTKHRGYWALSYLFAGAGFLTKGPIAVLIPAGVYLVWAVWNRKLNFSGIHPFMGVCILAVVVLPWYLLIYREYGWTYIGAFFLKDNLGRYLSDSFGPARGPLYYLSVFAVDFFPWSFPAIGALYLLWRNRRQWNPIKSLSFGLPLIWCLFIFFLFSVSKNKQEYYIAPIYPVAAVVLAAVLDGGFSRITGNTGKKITGQDSSSSGLNSPQESSQDTDRRPDVAWKWIYLLLCILLIAFSVLMFFILRFFMPHLAPVLHYVPSLVIACAVIFTVVCIIRRRISFCFPAIAASMWMIFMVGVIYYFPALEALRPVKSFCERIEAAAGADFEAGYYGVTVPSMVFYLQKRIFQEYNAASMASRFQSGTPVFCILTAKDHAYFTENTGLHLYVLDRSPRFSIKMKTILNAGYDPNDELLLVSNRPVSSPALKVPVPYNEK